jgi:hypothetical protein
VTEPKRHHHLPESYQAGFCSGERVWVFDRTTGRFRRDKPVNVATRTHDYTIYRSGETKDTRVEKFFAAVDGAAVPLIAKMRAQEQLTADERQTFSWYLAYFATRVPRFRRGVNEQETARRKLFDRAHLKSPSQLQALIDHSDLSDTERAEADAELMFEMLKSEDYWVELNHDYQVRLLFETGAELQPSLHDMHWCVAHARDAQFVTSDNPIVEAKSGDFLTFPVAADTAMILLRTKDDKVRQVHKIMPKDMIHLTNVETARACERIVVARDEEYIRQVVADAGIEGTQPGPLVDIGPPPTVAGHEPLS